MELACFIKKKGIRALVERNGEAGALANGVHSGFILLTVCTVIPERALLGGAATSIGVWERGREVFQGGQRRERDSGEEREATSQKARG